MSGHSFSSHFSSWTKAEMRGQSLTNIVLSPPHSHIINQTATIATKTIMKIFVPATLLIINLAFPFKCRAQTIDNASDLEARFACAKLSIVADFVSISENRSGNRFCRGFSEATVYIGRLDAKRKWDVEREQLPSSSPWIPRKDENIWFERPGRVDFESRPGANSLSTSAFSIPSISYSNNSKIGQMPSAVLQ